MAGGGGKEEEQDVMSVHSPCKAPPSSASSLSKQEQSQAQLELRFLEALEIYPPGKLKGMYTHCPSQYVKCLFFLCSVGDPDSVTNRVKTAVAEVYEAFCFISIHRHFVLYGVMEFLRRSFDRQFSSEEVLRLLDRFYNLEMLRGDDEDAEFPDREDDFSLPQSYFVKEES
ncbi:hypothetical protein Cgig2_023165 [Carnegiea gigantea]|uniref:Uncharacterized protein n=1 Tax=Carnegiea gigantea TaxID=171969 RepID=A0A9Q1Q8U1_9CARY|nr:hypothetical protein Cgig2_023165 [Carnegiea gigantea]